MTNDDRKTEAEAIAELVAGPAVLRDEEEEFGQLVVGLPQDWRVETIELERYGKQPQRLKGLIAVRDAASFAAACRDRAAGSLNPPVIYVDTHQGALEAVLNDDKGESPGWRDYRVHLELVKSPEWQLWLSHDGSFMSQAAFAEHIEEGLSELVDPPAADMLDLAQSFQASIDANFKQARRLASGATQFVYEEEVTASAGRAGAVEVPAQLELSVRPFYGSEPAAVSAWFRYRVGKDGVLLGYKIEKPWEVERAAFQAVVDGVREELAPLSFISGPPPQARP